MAKKPIRVGICTVNQLSHTRWRLRYRDPNSGTDVRRRLSGLSLKEVREIAAHVSQQALVAGDYLPGKRKNFPTIREGVEDAIRLSSANDETRKDYGVRAARFIKWLKVRHPKVETWDRIRPSMVREYVRELEREGKAWNTVRLALVPIKAAWKHMSENYPEGVGPLPRIKHQPPDPKEGVCLEPEEIDVLLEILQIQNSDLWGMAALQALAGLRMLEAAALRRQDVDLGSRFITVTDTGEHRPKNHSSFRTIPICEEASSILVEVMDRQKIIPSTGEIFRNRAGNVWNASGLSQKWRKMLRSESFRKVVKKEGASRLLEAPPHRLRASFSTMAIRLGAPDRILKAYLGHSCGDTLGRHYHVISRDDLRLVSSQMDGWRSLIRKSQDGKNLATLEGDVS